MTRHPPGIIWCSDRMCPSVTPLSQQTLSTNRVTKRMTPAPTSVASCSSNPLSASKLSLSPTLQTTAFVSHYLTGTGAYRCVHVSTVFDLISEHTLISGHPPTPHFVLVKTIARAHRDLCVLAVLLCCIMQSIFDAN